MKYDVYVPENFMKMVNFSIIITQKEITNEQRNEYFPDGYRTFIIDVPSYEKILSILRKYRINKRNRFDGYTTVHADIEILGYILYEEEICENSKKFIYNKFDIFEEAKKKKIWSLPNWLISKKNKNIA